MTVAHNGDPANGGAEIHYETFGSPSDPALVLINGLGGQSAGYPDEWCEMFVARGLFVVRLDNRDAGLSTKFEHIAPSAANPAYTLSDMAADVIAVLDDLHVDKAHVAGLSMGGMIVQTLAIEHPERLLTMTSVMSSTGEAGIGAPSKEAWAHLTAAPATDRAGYIANQIAGLRVWGSPAFADEDRWRTTAETMYDRSFSPAGTGRQFFAIAASGSREEALPSVAIPTLVIHGDQDTLIDQSGGRRTAELVPGARFELIEGMGHDYPPQLWARWVELIGDHALAAR